MDLELKRKELELSRLVQGIRENDFKILERMDDVRRIKENIKIQQTRIDELKSELKGD